MIGLNTELNIKIEDVTSTAADGTSVLLTNPPCIKAHDPLR